MLSIVESSFFRPKNPISMPYFGAMHGISPAIPNYQAQRACKPCLFRFSSAFLAITRLPNAQATALLTLLQHFNEGIRIGRRGEHTPGQQIHIADSLLAKLPVSVGIPLVNGGNGLAGLSGPCRYTPRPPSRLQKSCRGKPCPSSRTPVFFMPVAFREERNPELIQLVVDLDWLMTVTLFTGFALQCVAIVIASLQDQRKEPYFPRWLCYFLLWFALLTAPGCLALFFKTEPFSWKGIIVFWVPAVAFGLYFMAMVTMLLKAIKQLEAEKRSS